MNRVAVLVHLGLLLHLELFLTRLRHVLQGVFEALRQRLWCLEVDWLLVFASEGQIEKWPSRLPIICLYFILDIRMDVDRRIRGQGISAGGSVQNIDIFAWCV